MPQENAIYDGATFFANYLALPRQQRGHDGAPEWPILRAMVGSVDEHKIADLGCGLGWFARWAIEHGASHVDALDVSTKMMEKAKELTPNDVQSVTKGINYQVKDIALHYLSTPAFKEVVGVVHTGLKVGGRFVFSVEHPIYTAPSHDEFISVDLPTGKKEDAIWPLNRYGYEGLRSTNWLGGNVRKYHRTMTTYVQGLLEAGFAVSGFREYMATEEDLEKEPQWKGALERPMFLMVRVEKTKA